MVLRELEQSEHGKTRALWEKVFPEDSKAFLDYYYFIKTRENRIYVIEEDGEIRSMLHLNPYQVQMGTVSFLGHYIIAVATEEGYRGRGYMRQLLCRAMEDMYLAKEPFTYLMPAAEAIYTPYDFRFIYRQRQTELTLEDLPAAQTVIETKDAGFGDGAEMAAFFTEYFAEKYDVFALRDEAYYQAQVFEQQSEQGGIRLIRKKDQFVGMFAYAKEGGEYEIREPLYLPEAADAFSQAVRELGNESSETVKIYAAPESIASGCTEKPIIMARILHLQEFLSALETREEDSVCCSFAVVDPLIQKNSRIWKLESDAGSTKVAVKETEDSEGVFSISALTSVLFGYRKIEDVIEEEDVILSERLQQEFEKMLPFQKIFLNEIV